MNTQKDNFETTILTVGDWMITLLILAIPIANLVMSLVWAFSSTGNIHRRNFCRAYLIWMLIGIGLYIIIIIFAVIAGVALSDY